MSSRQLEDRQEVDRDAYVAQELGISVEALEEHSYDIEEAGFGLVWRIFWADTAPEGVKTEGHAGGLWTDIQPHHEPDGPDED
jgi:hypothetical protein